MSNRDGSRIVFREVQQFRARPRALLTLVPLSAAAGLLGLFVWNRASGSQIPEGLGVQTLVVLGVACVVFFGVALLLYHARLVTEVREDGLFVQYFPFQRSFQRIPLQDIERFETTTYKPILDYGGWGIRYGRGSKAYTVTGNRGVRATFFRGRDLLIGSQQSEELALALERLLKNRRGG